MNLYFTKVLHIVIFVYICIKKQTNSTVMSKLQLDYDTPRATVEIEAEYTFSVIRELQDEASSLSIKINIASIRVISAHDEDDNKLTDKEVERLMFKQRGDVIKKVQMQLLEGVIK